jgi:hypothetical protein
MRKLEPNPHTVPEPLSTTVNDGRIVTGTLWLHPSGLGSFEVEYNGLRNSDHRTDYTDSQHLRSVARLILAEMAGE